MIKKSLKIINNLYGTMFVFVTMILTIINAIFMKYNIANITRFSEWHRNLLVDTSNTFTSYYNSEWSSRFYNIYQANKSSDLIFNYFYSGDGKISFYLGVLFVFVLCVTLCSIEYCKKYNNFLLSMPINKKIYFIAKFLYASIFIGIYTILNFLVSVFLLYTSNISEVFEHSQSFSGMLGYHLAILLQLIIIGAVLFFIGSFTGNFIGQIATAIPIFFNLLYLFFTIFLLLNVLNISAYISINDLYGYNVENYNSIIWVDAMALLLYPLRIKELSIILIFATLLFCAGVYLCDKNRIEFRGKVYLFKIPSIIFKILLVINLASLSSTIFGFLYNGINIILFLLFLAVYYIICNKLFEIKIGN